MTRPHWHVIHGMSGGYLPDGDEPDTFETRAQATAYAREGARETRDLLNVTDGSGPRPSRDERWSITSDRVGRSGPFVVTIDRYRNPYSLPYYWEGWECTESDCEHMADDIGPEA